MLVQTPERALPSDFVRARTRTRKTNAEWGMGMKTEPSYIPLGHHVTCVADPVYPWPLWMVRMIRKQYDPGFIPIFRRMAYQTPAGAILTFVHHGVARFDPTARPDRVVEAATLPFGWKFERPNIVERWFEPAERVAGSIRAKNNLPKPFIAWGDWVQRWVEETYWDASAETKQEFVEKNGEEAKRHAARLAAQAETEYGNKQEAQYRKRLIDEIGPQDYKEGLARAAGHIEHERTPFVHLNGA